MPKSPNILIPATGAAALVLGVAYGVATNNYASDKVDVMERQVEQAQAAATGAASAAEAELARVTALEADMQAKVAEIQNEARLALATASGDTMAVACPRGGATCGRATRSSPSNALHAMASSPKVSTTGRRWPVGSIRLRTKTP